MPRQNRVTPFGILLAIPERGTMMGNRGVLHDAAGRIRRPWQVARWLVCMLEFRGRKRSVMTPGHYTELFFLDEATALAAGHRPCAECRRAHFLSFAEAWRSANASGSSSRPTAPEIDRCLHAERIAADGSQRHHAADLDDLPDGVFVTLPDQPARAYLVWGGHLRPWSAAGYGPRIPQPRGVSVSVLTPP